MLRDERGFTLPELLTTIAILGILIGIAMGLWNSVIESRRVDSAANQLASDLRLAHIRATNQLTDWRVVVVLNRDDQGQGPDYYLMKLQGPYPANSPPVIDGAPIARTFPENVKAVQPGYQDNQGDPFFISPESPTPPSTLTFEFNSDGGAVVFAGVDGAACITVDNDPQLRVLSRAATSQVEIQDASC